jgi:toxin ParE1/3/4
LVQFDPGWFSRNTAARGADSIRQPRHFLLYRVAGNVVEIGRVLHDSMELDLHLPEEYRSQP